MIEPLGAQVLSKSRFPSLFAAFRRSLSFRPSCRTVVTMWTALTALGLASRTITLSMRWPFRRVFFRSTDDVTAWLLGDLQSTYPAAGVSAVTYSKQTGRISIIYSGSATFAIQATSIGQLGRVLGTDPLGLITYGQGGILNLPSIATLAPINTVFMRIAELPSLMASTNGQSAFARLQMAAAPGSVVMQNVGSGVVNTNNYQSPIASLSTLTVSLYTQDGVAVDLHGVEFSFTLLIVSA